MQKRCMRTIVLFSQKKLYLRRTSHCFSNKILLHTESMDKHRSLVVKSGLTASNDFIPCYTAGVSNSVPEGPGPAEFRCNPY